VDSSFKGEEDSGLRLSGPRSDKILREPVRAWKNCEREKRRRKKDREKKRTQQLHSSRN
jgi:hypothetical protein